MMYEDISWPVVISAISIFICLSYLFGFVVQMIFGIFGYEPSIHVCAVAWGALFLTFKMIRR